MVEYQLDQREIKHIYADIDNKVNLYRNTGNENDRKAYLEYIRNIKVKYPVREVREYADAAANTCLEILAEDAKKASGKMTIEDPNKAEQRSIPSLIKDYKDKKITIDGLNVILRRHHGKELKQLIGEEYILVDTKVTESSQQTTQTTSTVNASSKKIKETEEMGI